MTIPSEIQPILDAASSTIPVDLMSVANRLGLQIYSAKLADGVSGVLVRDSSYGTPSGFVIFVDADEPAARQRFTAAHEIAHFVLHRNEIGDRVEDNYLLRSEGLSSRQEAEANRFAADLLMPMSQVNQHMQAGVNSVDALAKKFGVSRTAMSIRLGLPT